MIKLNVFFIYLQMQISGTGVEVHILDESTNGRYFFILEHVGFEGNSIAI